MASYGHKRPPKRKKPTSGTDGDQPPAADIEPKNSSTVWYKDGSIILQAESTRFRVHHTVLAQNSPIFEDMLNIGEASGEDTVDGCPFVILHDAAADLEAVLRALYDRRYFDTHEEQPFGTVASILRVSKKYEIQHLYDRALEYLTDQFPSTLAGWDARLYRMPRYEGFTFDVIALARELDLARVLPAAFYRCVELYGAAFVLEGLRDPATGRVKRLAPHDQKVAVLGMQNAVTRSLETTFAWLKTRPEVDGCEDIYECDDAMRDISDALWMPFPRCAALWKWQGEWNKSLCKKCIAALKEMHYEGRAKFWEQLPACFDLPPWKDQ
ncbi:hypothetical protein PLICRDRAFT_118734 [Plicaturopsis crispa FD-325 SS-3]|uniref:BTB domain-containing protein n=1 Tax=Plicaturopsis crispa FD-325 SS-3 TaxID=944288 RepID=A0A0C9SQS1_PLICR|nr:hypothetical protein PLICRDRAFT_118734 [Plicaturopsis crispa FD-325 SS-3]